MLSGAVQVVATGATTWLLDKAGRRLFLIISSVGMTLRLFLVAMTFFLKDALTEDSQYYMWSMVSLVALVIYIISFSLGIGAIPEVIMSEIFPVNIKSLASSIATLANWFCSWGETMTAILLLDWSSGGTFTIYAIVTAFTVMFVSLWLPETKGRTLEDIQFSFR